MGRYIPSTGAEQQEMLRSIGLDDFRQLYKDVPEQMYLERGLDTLNSEVYSGQGGVFDRVYPLSGGA